MPSAAAGAIHNDPVDPMPVYEAAPCCSRCRPTRPSTSGYRDAGYSFLTIGIADPAVADATRAHAAAALKALTPWSDGTCLPNLQTSADPAQVVRKYDPATLNRLAALPWPTTRQASSRSPGRPRRGGVHPLTGRRDTRR